MSEKLTEQKTVEIVGLASGIISLIKLIINLFGKKPNKDCGCKRKVSEEE
jgi:hypothetical protein